jgi:2,4-dienoyl-CoA reductase-like NADH-dependent reductase (Old Yellow Enzyme family)
LQLQNRIVMAPLTCTRADNQGKVPNKLMAEYYAQRAGAGLIITEAPCKRTGTRLVWQASTTKNNAPGGSALQMPFRRRRVDIRSTLHQAPSLIASCIPTGGCRLGLRSQSRATTTSGGKIMSETPCEMSLHDIKQAVKDFRHAAHRARRWLRRCPNSRRIRILLPTVPTR